MRSLLRRGAGAAAAVSSVVRCRKISSRLMRIGRSSSRPQPRADDRGRELAAHVAAARAVAPRSRSTLPRVSATARRRVTPGDRRQRAAARRRPARPPGRTSSPSRAAATVRLSGVSTATTRPLLMMTTRWQVWLTSGRMCVLRMTVWSPPSSLISCRVSMICFGSRPAVGSSRISTSGLCSSACARPTRCR